MNSDYIALAVIFSAVTVGASIPLIHDTGSLEAPEFSTGTLEKHLESRGETSESGNNTELVYGTAHKHALFQVVINGSEKDFTAGKFQLNSKFVHLENNRSSIVHSHAEGVTWKKFLETINTSVSQNQSYVCVEIYGNESCGRGTVVLNGERNPELDREIGQGDSFLAVLDTDNTTQLVEEYMKKQLPRLYKKSKDRGFRI